jgi:alanyl-tRNA synthetase
MRASEFAEGRMSGVEFTELEDRVIASLKSHDSQVYTKLAQKTERIKQLKDEIKALEEEVKQSTRSDVADLFAAEDAVKTRVIETLSYILTLSKDPEPTKVPKYKDILEELSKQLTPELILVLEALKEQMVTVTQKAPSLRIKPVKEGRLDNLLFKFKEKIFGWANRYDQKLAALRRY